jgi:GNAT superfamily N-acetyltransferase
MHEWTQGEYTISTDPARLDIVLIHDFLKASYWAAGVPREIVERSIRHSLPFGVYKGALQIGFARVITDYATFAYLADVFVLADHRGQGLSKWLMEVIVSHPDLQGLRRWMLATRDAHGLYQNGFKALKHPARWMELHHPDVYTAISDGADHSGFSE